MKKCATARAGEECRQNDGGGMERFFAPRFSNFPKSQSPGVMERPEPFDWTTTAAERRTLTAISAAE